MSKTSKEEMAAKQARIRELLSAFPVAPDDRAWEPSRVMHKAVHDAQTLITRHIRGKLQTPKVKKTA